VSEPVLKLLSPSLENILYATDYSPCAKAALPYLRAIAERYGSTVHVVHVCSPDPRTAVPTDQFPELDAVQYIAEVEMKALLASTAFGDIAHTSTVVRGQLWEVLAAVIKQKNIDLIVIGTHGRRGLTKVVLGSVAEQVLRHAPCPVLTVGPHVIDGGVADASFARILLATDYSLSSRHALSYALSLARANKAHLMLIHAVTANLELLPTSAEYVSPGMQMSAEFVAQVLVVARQHLAELISNETMQELNPEIIVECGSTAETILEIAKSRQANLIVMGAHSGFASSIITHLPWATASTVISQARCPVLTVRLDVTGR